MHAYRYYLCQKHAHNNKNYFRDGKLKILWLFGIIIIHAMHNYICLLSCTGLQSPQQMIVVCSYAWCGIVPLNYFLFPYHSTYIIAFNNYLWAHACQSGPILLELLFTSILTIDHSNFSISTFSELILPIAWDQKAICYCQVIDSSQFLNQFVHACKMTYLHLMCMQANAMTARANDSLWNRAWPIILKSRKEEESIKKVMQETVEVSRKSTIKEGHVD